MEINWGIIGCGDVTEIKSGPAFNKVPKSYLAAVMRRDAEKAEGYAARHGVKKWYTNANNLIADPDVNAIYIATPPDSHEHYTIAALSAGKPVYVEKPMARNSAESVRMMEAAEKHLTKLTVAHYRRAQPKFLKIKELIELGEIGEIKTVDLQILQKISDASLHSWRFNPVISGGGLFHDLAPHQLDLMLYFFGNPGRYSGNSLNKRNLSAADDYVTASINFGGIDFNGVWDFTADSSANTDLCVIEGTRGRISFATFGDHCQLMRNGQSINLTFDPLPHVQEPMIREVVKYFMDEGANPCPASEGVIVMRMIDEITSS